MPGRNRTPAQRAAETRYQVGKDLLGHPLGQALKVMAKDTTFTGREGLLAWLRSGPTVTVNCLNGTRTRKHRVTLNTDGTLTLHHHPDVDFEGEQVMGALAGYIPTCIVAAMYVPTREVTPAWIHGGRQSVDSRLRIVHAAVAWAQEPDTDWSAVARLVHEAVTPAVVRQWEAEGFSLDQAFPFWKAMAPIEVAKAWLAAGDTTARAARLAADGTMPEADGPWLAAGFNRSAAQPWRRSTPLDPAEAYEWSRRGFGIGDYQVICGNRGYRRPAGMTRQVAFAWADAGIHGTHVMSWHLATGGDLDEALAWYPTGIRPAEYAWLQSPTASLGGPLRGGPRTVSLGEGLPVARVQEWSDAGFPMTEARLLFAVDRSGLSPARFAQAAGFRPVHYRDVRDLLTEILGYVPRLLP